MKMRSRKIKNHRRSKHSRRYRRTRQGGIRGSSLGLSLDLERANAEASEKIRDNARTPSPKYTDLDPSNPRDALLLRINKDLAEIDRIATSGSYRDIFSGPTNVEESQSERKRRTDALAEAQKAFLRIYEGGRTKKTKKFKKIRKSRRYK